MITRRQWLSVAATGSAVAAATPGVVLPVLCLTNKLAYCTHEQVSAFRTEVWQEAIGIFSTCGIRLDLVERESEIRKYPSGQPRFYHLDKSRLNIVLTDHVPLDWDNGRYSPGIAASYEGCAVCVIAMPRAHGNRIPLLAVNTLVHEMLHVLLGDIYDKRGGLISSQGRETRIDWHATRMWLLGRDAAVVEAASQFGARRKKREVRSQKSEARHPDKPVRA